MNHCFVQKRNSLRITAVILSMALFASTAYADEYSDDATMWAEEGFLMIGGLVLAMGNAASAGKGEKSAVGWRVGGNIAGGLNMITGIGLLAAVLIIDDSDFPDYNLFLGLGIGHIAMGILDFSAAGWAQSQPDHEAKTEVKVSPVIIPSRQGAPALGAAVSIVGW